MEGFSLLLKVRRNSMDKERINQILKEIENFAPLLT
jgi:hypothetical protein